MDVDLELINFLKEINNQTIYTEVQISYNRWENAAFMLVDIRKSVPSSIVYKKLSITKNPNLTDDKFSVMLINNKWSGPIPFQEIAKIESFIKMNIFS